MATEQIWEKIAIALLSGMMVGAPGYFIVGPSKPDRDEVIKLIEDRTPIAMENVITNLKEGNTHIDKRLSIMEERLGYISKSIEDRLEYITKALDKVLDKVHKEV